MSWIRTVSAALALLASQPLAAAGLEVQPVTEGVYAIVGEMDQRSPENLANNATFGLVVTAAGLVLVDPGGTRAGAERIHEAIRTVSDRTVALVINTGGQDHRWLGNGYWKAQGARIVASEAAVADQRARARDQINALWQLVGEAGLRGTEPLHADETFGEALDLELGGVRFELRHAGPAHTPGDSFVWLPDRGVVFTGDIVYVERMLGVGAQSHSGRWLESFEALAALQPAHVVPGHGHATDLARARADTYDYLRFLRAAVRELLDAGGGMEEVGGIDQSRFDYLAVSDQIAGRNAQQVYAELEFE
ncbi:MAG: MBL fold metallo-hydrolase [Gammaproteobacteria bacterium]|nr:MBL fold metallo-hydrolase [Gammaproteobacteria bacterium]